MLVIVSHANLLFSLQTHDVKSAQVKKGDADGERSVMPQEQSLPPREDEYIMCECVFILRSGSACRIRTNESSKGR